MNDSPIIIKINQAGVCFDIQQTYEPPHGKTNNLHRQKQGADQLRGNRGNREADQRLCFRYTDSTIPLLYKSKISSL